MFIITTNRADGSVYGPFASVIEAERYGRSHCVGCCWHVVMLQK